MKNIAFFAFLVIILFLFLSTNPLFCEEPPEKNYNLSFGISSGFVYGQSIELVYPVDTPSKYLSELLWDMKPVFYLGLKVNFTRHNLKNNLGLFASLTFNFGIPNVSGILKNRDWMNEQNEALTHYSEHINKTKEFFWMDAAFGFSIPVKNYFNLRPLLNASWMRFAFSGRDGYGEYNFPGWPLYVNYEDEVIRYEQDWLILAAGLSIETEILSPFYFEISFKVSPLIYCAAIDAHLLTSYTFNDYMGFGLFLEPEASISFRVRNIAFTLEFSYRYIEGTKGITYINGGSSNFYAANNSGAGLSVINTRFAVRFII